MNFRYEPEQEDFRPRLIMWELEPTKNGSVASGVLQSKIETLNTEESMQVLESIARLAKPIIVFTGTHLLKREDMFSIVEYGHGLGLKMIIETPPEDITQELLRQFSIFGPRVFRIAIDNCIIEDMDTRFRRTTEFYTLERCIRLLKSAGYEIHLATTIDFPHVRALAFEHDYAFRRSARGLYCHLNFNREKLPKGKQNDYTEEQIEEYLEAIAKIKRFSPDNMYFSPQCVQYGYVGFSDLSFESNSPLDKEKGFQWKHICLAGKRFAYINAEAKVQLCSGLNANAGDLRITGFDFQEVWESSDIFRELRDCSKSCRQTRDHIQSEYACKCAQGNDLSVEYML
jgi:MoaA/NifB/PqqE/SkfB family radical SAM enzyme